MLEIRKAEDRGGFDFGWLKTRHSFSFGEYLDPARMGFGSLRVLNEDWIQPGQGFGMHGHRDMEILTWVLEGTLTHQDSLGSQGTLRPGEVQVMGAGSGIRHSEFNASDTETCHLLQIWLLPDTLGLPPRYAQQAHPDSRFRNTWGLIASPLGEAGALPIHQDARVSVSRLEAGAELALDVQPGRRAYLQVARGQLEAGQHPLSAGDALAVQEPGSWTLKAHQPSEVLWFDLG